MFARFNEAPDFIALMLAISLISEANIRIVQIVIDDFGAGSARLRHQLSLQLVDETLDFRPISWLGLLNSEDCADAAAELGDIQDLNSAD